MARKRVGSKAADKKLLINKRERVGLGVELSELQEFTRNG